MKQELSRRGFLAGVATSGAALAAASILGCAPSSAGADKQPTPEAGAEGGGAGASANPEGMSLPSTFDFEWYPPIQGDVAYEDEPVSDFAETMECDMVVCGGGLAGVSAALSGSENGLNVVLLEKSGQFVGRGAQLGAIGSRVQREAGSEEVDPEAFVNDGVYSMGNRVDRRVWARYAAFSGQAADWLVEQVGDACGPWKADSMQTVVNNGVPFWASTIQPAKMAGSIAPAVGELIQQRGVDVRFETPAVQLVQEGDAVVGVVAKDASGNYLRFNASKGVVLATGGYENNWDMLCRNMEPRDLAVGTWRNTATTNTGDGHMMGEAVGAQMDDYPHAIANDPGASVKSNTYCRPLAQGFLRVNDLGKRFCNEGASQEHVGAAIAVQPGAHCYMIMAGDIEANITELFEKRHLPFPIPDMVEALKSEVVEAATLEELADTIGVDKANLVETIANYNRFYDEQRDEEYGKDPSCLLAVREAPFYAIEEQNASLVTVSGLKIDEYSRVLDRFAHPIEGLYALGNVSGSMFDGYYPHHCQAISHGRCVTFGYLVGRRLAGIED